MELTFLFKGILIGLLGSIPLGPIGVLCIQRTLNKHFKAGFCSGLGAATADTLFATVAMFFLTLVMSFIESRMQLLTVVGGIIIIGIGLSIYYKKTTFKRGATRARNERAFKDYISVFLLTLTNPAYILVFVALFTSLGFESSPSLRQGIPAVLGVFAGASGWWFLLTFFINKVRRKFRPRHLVALNKVAGGIIILLGIITILSVVFEMPGVGMEHIVK